MSWRWERENLRCIVCWEFQFTWMFILDDFFLEVKIFYLSSLMLLSASMSTKFCCQICANMLKDVHPTWEFSHKYFLINFLFLIFRLVSNSTSHLRNLQTRTCALSWLFSPFYVCVQLKIQKYVTWELCELSFSLSRKNTFCTLNDENMARMKK